MLPGLGFRVKSHWPVSFHVSVYLYCHKLSLFHFYTFFYNRVWANSNHISDFLFCYRAIKDDSPFSRIKTIVKWYLSGFYKKPKGLKKPYNPILGEKFRCYWKHPSGSKTFYIAEQVKFITHEILNTSKNTVKNLRD